MSTPTDSSLRTSNFELPAAQRILVIGLSNIGDGVLMMPVVASLRERFPHAHLTLLVGERAQALFAHDPRVQRLECMEDFGGWLGRLRLIRLVWSLRPDALIDLRHTLLPLAWRPWRIFRYVRPVPRHVVHMRDRHLWRLSIQLGRQKAEGRRQNDSIPRGEPHAAHDSVWIPEEARQQALRLLDRWHVDQRRPLVLICPAARSHTKRWDAARFGAVADRLIEEARVEVVLTGEPDEAPVIQDTLKAMRQTAHSALGLTTLQQLAVLMQRAQLVITNDSASLHLACAVDAPVLALFGPTDPRKYGPTGPRDRVIHRRLFCAPCEQALCRFSHECMRFISVEEVYETAKAMLTAQRVVRSSKLEVRSGQHEGLDAPRRPVSSSNFELRTSNSESVSRRILVIRLDRIGDVVLSTPVLQVLREAYPTAYLAMMVRPVCRELVEDNLSLNHVLLYDKDARHRGILSSIRFALGLRRWRFDTALVLHPSHRSHWIPWLAGIPVRIGYERKTPWLLTRRLPHDKPLGSRHESDYALDAVRALGVTVHAIPDPVVRPSIQARADVEAWLAHQGVPAREPLIALHPSASDPVKRWPADRFARLGDRLAASHGVRIIIVNGPDDVTLGREMAGSMASQPVDASGQFSLGTLAALFARCRVVVSNDSGPVHLAAAVGTPVVSLFGRNQPGLGPRRWGPVGAGHLAVHKDAQDSRRVCLDARCPYPFLDITSLSVDEVYQVVVSVLERHLPSGELSSST
ncbi:MAG: lipopolysaccharide heptosyltransferase II [Candidatus Omnitrophica bacterium]|nr:lipopolysaccharide heptosyltransferase II [Candidatus Omnitrophota bacterium]